MKTKLDLIGFSKEEIKELCNSENYSIRTYYRSLSRGWMYVSILND